MSLKQPLKKILNLKEHRKNKHAPLDFYTGKYRGYKIKIIKKSVGYEATTNLNDRVFTKDNLGFIMYDVKNHIDDIISFREDNI